MERERRWMVMCGVATMDWLASVDNYPEPDEKIRTTALQVLLLLSLLLLFFLQLSTSPITSLLFISLLAT